MLLLMMMLLLRVQVGKTGMKVMLLGRSGRIVPDRCID
jgi:hypothetical protein